MFDWTEKYKSTNKELREISHPRFHLKKAAFESPLAMTELARFISSASALLEDNVMNSYSAKDKTVRELLFNDVAPHFENVKIVYYEDEISVVNMQFLKEDSKTMFHSTSTGIIQVIYDLYRTNDRSIWTSGKERELTWYSVKVNELYRAHLRS
ncbi:hypothetical protein [Paenibacillus herberti]|uniref:Uncharacterized protein n=1 Tax=Paenibacillus herberti TaxID=1619309 RepID=A0A229NWZ3_9BACL|nr:hypothetical protein [Paenibacillus herberti]OXM14453.1 hypothetical protein CGZ75_16045 [Paenibacillus herberti]